MTTYGTSRANGTNETGYKGGGPVETPARIRSIRKEQGGVWTALLHAPDIARRARPMQFVEIKVGPSTDPFLRRPFGLSRLSPEEGYIGITWAVVGKGTSLMAGWREGDTVSVLGPLGNGFQPDWILCKALPTAGSPPGKHRPVQHAGVYPAGEDATGEDQGSTDEGRSVWLVAGGTGLAPLYPLAQSVRPLCSDITLVYGAKTSALLMDTSPFEAMGCRVTVCTEDGSEGIKGWVTEPLKHFLASLAGGLKDNPPLAVACGPTPMLRAAKAMLRSTPVELHISLEERMACGAGLCKGCAVKAAPPREGYLHVCTDGPVFRAGEVLLGGESQGT